MQNRDKKQNPEIDSFPEKIQSLVHFRFNTPTHILNFYVLYIIKGFIMKRVINLTKKIGHGPFSFIENPKTCMNLEN